jgi:hypothetical protein
VSEAEQAPVSGPYCRHWHDPSDCDILCLACGHKCCAHGRGECGYGGGDCECEKFKDDEENG